MADMEGNETFDPSSLGQADEVVEERVADDNMVMIRGSKFSRATTLLLRGANDYMLDEMDRAIHDALCVIKRVLESGKVVPGEPLDAAWPKGMGYWRHLPSSSI